MGKGGGGATGGGIVMEEHLVLVLEFFLFLHGKVLVMSTCSKHVYGEREKTVYCDLLEYHVFCLEQDISVRQHSKSEHMNYLPHPDTSNMTKRLLKVM